MNRPASTYVIIAHFTASGDFSQTKRGKKKRAGEKQLVVIRAPLHQSPVHNGTSATKKNGILEYVLRLFSIHPSASS